MVLESGVCDTIMPCLKRDERRNPISSVDLMNGDPTGSVTSSTSNSLCSPMITEGENIQSPLTVMLRCESAVPVNCRSSIECEYDPCGSRRRRNLSFFPIDDLVDSLVVEILCRIRSSKSLIRCKCVSRRWFNLVSSHFFVKHRFLNHHGVGHPTKPSPSTMQHNLSLLKMDPKECRFWFHRMHLPLGHKCLCLLASHNDLILFALEQRNNYFPDPSQFYICNPFTMDFIPLPPAPELEEADHYLGGSGLLVKHHSSKKAEENCDATSNQPQFWVVCQRRKQGSEIGTYIYSSKFGTWKETFLSGSHVVKLKNAAAAHNDRLYWVMLSDRDNYQDMKIIAYDPNTMQSQYIDGPKIDDNPELLCKFMVGSCCGFLRLVATVCRRVPDHCYNGHLGYLVIWELKDHESGEWSLMHKIYFNQMVCQDPSVQKFVSIRSYSHWVCPLAIEKDDRNTVYLRINRFILSCDLKKKELEVVLARYRSRNPNYPLSVVLQQQPTPLRDSIDFEFSRQINN